jgi:hypothetical protein
MGRRSGVVVLAVALMASQTAFAADAPTPQAGPLAPGGAAGIRTAQTNTQLNGIAIVGVIGLAAVGIYLIVGTHYHVPGSHAASGTK